MKVVPYVCINDEWSIPFGIVLNIYNKMVEEGTDKIVFCSGSVKSFKDFLVLMNDKKKSIITIWDDKEIIMIAWMTTVNKISAHAHFNCFKKIWGKQPEKAVRMGLDYWFSFKHRNGKPIFDTIIGMIPDDNQRAVSMIKKCGAKIIGNIPNYSTNIYTKKKIGATVLYIER